MSFLFTVENKIVTPHTETLLVYPFSDIWDRDKTKDKREAIEDFTYIEFVSSVKKSNPYSGYPDGDRQEKVKKDIIKRDRWVEDKLIKQAIQYIIKLQKEGSTTYNYYMSAKVAAEKLQNFFNNLDMTQVNEKTQNPLYKPKDITSALNDTSKLLENLHSLEEKVNNDLYEESKNRGQKVISPFANPSSL